MGQVRSGQETSATFARVGGWLAWGHLATGGANSSTSSAPAAPGPCLTRGALGARRWALEGRDFPRLEGAQVACSCFSF